MGFGTGRNVSNMDGGGSFHDAYAKGYYGRWGPNTFWDKNTGRGTKYTGDVVFGLTLNAQSSWSKYVNIHYSFGKSKEFWHFLYGRDGTPTIASTVYAY
jgi:hypothetical protein